MLTSNVSFYELCSVSTNKLIKAVNSKPDWTAKLSINREIKFKQGEKYVTLTTSQDFGNTNQEDVSPLDEETLMKECASSESAMIDEDDISLDASE